MPSNSDSDDPLDPILLHRLHKRLMELRRSDHTASADEVLEELHPSIRGTYESPLLQLLGESENADNEVTLDPNFEETRQEEWTVDLPAGFNVTPVDLPPAKRRKSRKSKLPEVDQELQHELPEYIGKFRVKGELGRGANGVVYLGYDEELQRNVAIKLSLVTDDRYQERLRVEASKAAQIDADGIVPVHHIGTTDSGAVYIVQKYIEGSTLRDILKNNGPLSPARGVRLIREIAMSLEPAHLQDILHRDLKPDNILIDQTGKAWIADFGLAISEEEQQGRRSELAGTPAYMSPEQIKGRIDFLDPRSDIWAVGVMFYEVLTGKLPFSGKDRKTLADQICERDPRPMQQRAPQQLTEEMNAVFDRCCAKKPADRFASTHELIGALTRLVDAGLSEHNIDGKLITAYATDSLFKYATTTDHESISARHTRSTMRTERVTATQHSSLQRAPTIQETTSRRAMWLSAAAMIGVLGLLGYLVFGPKNEAQTTVTPDVTNNDPNPPVIDPPAFDGDGSRDRPWVVAADGSGSDETIQSALQRSGEEHFIKVVGEITESLEITESVTIFGASPDELQDAAAQDQQPSSGATKATIRSTEDRTIFVRADEDDQIFLENLYLDGGDPNIENVNTIDLVAGKLTIKDCRVESRSQNCIKVHGGALTVTGTKTHFRAPPEPDEDAIVVDGGGLALIENADFSGGGVEFNSNGDLRDCRFAEGAIVTTQSATVSIDACRFEGASSHLEVRAGSNTRLGSGCVFQQSSYGAIVYFDRIGSDIPKGKLIVEDAVFERCIEGIYVAGGELSVWQDCQFKQCGAAIRIEVGQVKLESPQISGGQAGVVLRRADNNLSENFPVEEGPAELLIHGGQITGSASFGLILDHPQGKCTIEGAADNDSQTTKFTDNALGGILLNICPEFVVKGAVFSGGDTGVSFDRTQASELASYVIQDSTFTGQQTAPVEAFGNVAVTLRGCELPDDAIATLQRVPQIIIEAEESN